MSLRPALERLARGLSLRGGVLRLPDGQRAPRADAARALEDWLYERFFIDWRPREGRFSDSVGGAPHFTALLLAATGTTSWFDERFRVLARHPDGVFVENGVVRLYVRRRADLRPPSPRRGGQVSVRLPCAREAAMAGFFCFNSRVGRLPDERPHLKVYLNVLPALAPVLLEGLLHDHGLRRARFDGKIVNDPDAFGRRDTALLYVEPRSLEAVLGFLGRLRARRPRGFRAAVPPFVLPLGRGVGVAESPPGDEESFGAQRCRLTALGLLAWLDGDAASAWAGVSSRFAAEGLDATRPWLGVLPASWVARAQQAMRPSARRAAGPAGPRPRRR
ncbi:MAG: hypothetical protein IAE78_26150 [Myxococcus sp.]|nr:hypothetical protein [Myxococcus sp.]